MELLPMTFLLYVSPSPSSFSYLEVCDKQANLCDIRRHFTDSTSPLYQLFEPEWLAHVADALGPLVNEKDIGVGKTIELPTCRRAHRDESQHPDMIETTGHDTIRTFWLSEKLPDGRVDVKLCVANADGKPLAETSPYDQLFKTSGLPLLGEVVAAPRDYYEMEKVAVDFYKLTRKDNSPPSPWPASEDGHIVNNQPDLPPELWRDILRLTFASGDKMALIPAILHMRLVNRVWNEVATSLYHTTKTCSVSSIVDYPYVFRPYLRRLRVHDVGIRLYRPPERSNYLKMLEDVLTHILAESPLLDEITLFNPCRWAAPVHVVGWRRETSELDVFEAALVSQLDCHLHNLKQLSAKATKILASITQQIDGMQHLGSCKNALEEAFLSAPKRFHCLAPPGEALISALGRFFSFFTSNENLPCEIPGWSNWRIEFSVAGNWGMEEAVKWVEEGEPWVRGGWPNDVEVLVYGWDEERTAKIPVMMEKSGRQLRWHYYDGVLTANIL